MTLHPDVLADSPIVTATDMFGNPITPGHPLYNTRSKPQSGKKPMNVPVDKEFATLVVYCKKNLRGETVELHINGDTNNARMANVIEKDKQFVAIFLKLPPGNHKVFHLKGDRTSKSSQVTVYQGIKSEIDWRGSFKLW